MPIEQPGTGQPSAGPRAEYEARLEARRRSAAAWSRRDRRLSLARGVVFASAALAWWLAVGPELVSGWLLLAPLAAFLALVVIHERVARRLAAARRAVAFYERGLDRLADRWAGRGNPGGRFADEGHLYGADLDLFGPGSLYELLCTARTRVGEERLASWLAAPAAPEVIRLRQAAVQELRPRLALREELAVIAEQARGGVDSAALARWVARPARPFPSAARLACALLAVWNAAAGVAWAAGAAGAEPFLAGLAASGIAAAVLRGRVAEALAGLDRSARDLALLARLLDRIEAEAFSAPLLAGLRDALEVGGARPSARVARLASLLDLHESKRNQLFYPFAAALLWTTQIAMEVEAWRAANGAAVASWIGAVAELEALCALASHAYEHPGDVFPEIVGEGPCYDAAGAGHPLLAESRCVRNDVRLDAALRLLVVSGSNMSGKSTLLRTVGTNLVLALAGAPVRAERLRVSPLSLGASIRLHDSLQAGTSRFYAEITRLRQIMDQARERPPLLFLLDEVLHGTNSGDRRVGAEAVVRALLARGAVGLVTTHDLSLAHIAEAIAPAAANVHFEDHLEDGRIRFDYRMRPGVVQKSNALALMRAVGLEV